MLFRCLRLRFSKFAWVCVTDTWTHSRGLTLTYASLLACVCLWPCVVMCVCACVCVCVCVWGAPPAAAAAVCLCFCQPRRLLQLPSGSRGEHSQHTPLRVDLLLRSGLWSLELPLTVIEKTRKDSIRLSWALAGFFLHLSITKNAVF